MYLYNSFYCYRDGLNTQKLYITTYNDEKYKVFISNCTDNLLSKRELLFKYFNYLTANY